MKKAMRDVTLMMLFQLALHVVGSLLPMSGVLRRIPIYLGMLVPTAVFYWRRRGDAPDEKTDPRGAARCAALIAPFMLFICPALNLVSSEIAEFGAAGNAPSLSAYSLLFSVILTPIIEELFMRGAVLGTVKEEADSGTAITVSAFLFALMHLNILSLPYALVAGLFLGLARVASGSVAAPIILHAANNLLTILYSEAAVNYGKIPVFAVYFSSLALLCVLTLVCRREALRGVMHKRPMSTDALKGALLSPVLIYVIATVPLFILNI